MKHHYWDLGHLFPDTTICNFNPLAPTQFTNLTASHLHEYLHRLHNLTRDDDMLRHDLLTYAGYYQQISREHSISLGHQQDSFIARCQLKEVDPYTERSVPCSGHTDIKLLSLPGFFNCFTIHVNSSDNGGGGRLGGIDLVLHIGNEGDKTTVGFHPTTDSRGALIKVHRPFSWPNLNNAIHLLPGKYVSIRQISEVFLSQYIFQSISYIIISIYV